MLVVKCRESDVSHSCVVVGSCDAAFGCQYCSKLLSIEDIDKAQDVAATVGRNGCSGGGDCYINIRPMSCLPIARRSYCDHRLLKSIK